jgi:hypothetical protein
MTEYKDIVERQAKLIAAEEWAVGVKGVHAHSLNSMWYDNRPQDTEDANVLDIQYNDGLIERRLKSGEIKYFGERLFGDELIYEWEKHDGKLD